MTSALDRIDDGDLPPLRCGDRLLPVGERTLIMGIVNTSPDSFSGDGLAGDVDGALSLAEGMVADGADIVDVGGQSTRPGSEPVGAEEETARTVPVVAAIAERLDCVVSIDTSRPEVAERAIEAGAGFVNDVSGLRADGMIERVAQAGVPACIMHMRGTPRTMQADPRYDDLMGEIVAFLAERIEAAVAGGIARSQLVVDPGFGFGKTVAHNLEILRRLGELRGLGLAVLLGTSRKSTIGAVLDLPVDERVFGGAATCALGIAGGADILRVHDVREMKQVAVMADAVVRGWRGGA
jgi:dihydropteroate synthase